MADGQLLALRKQFEEEGFSLLAELNEVLKKRGIEAEIHSFFVSTQPVATTKVQVENEPMKCGFCCWSVGPATMGCGICCDF